MTGTDQPIDARAEDAAAAPDAPIEHVAGPTPHGAASQPAREPDALLAAAAEQARVAAVEVGGDAVGDHLAVVAEGDLVATHAFAATLPGYTGWYWAVTVARAPEVDTVTVDEVVLLPGADALLAPPWVPWQERLQPGDLSPGDLLPARPDDPRLVPAYVDSGDPQVDEVAFELGLGRARVLSRDGRLDAAERWYAGDGGPDTPMARQAPARCGTCGFLLPLAGTLRAGFGVCANEITATDGRVVSVEYGCGAHSEIDIVVPSLAERSGEVYDDGDEIVEVRSAMTAAPAEDAERVEEAVTEEPAAAASEAASEAAAAEAAAEDAPAEEAAGDAEDGPAEDAGADEPADDAPAE